MNPDEKRGYSKGYKAGLRRAEPLSRAEFWQQCYLALLPAAMQVQGWKIGDVQVTDSHQRIDLARRWANKAAENYKDRA